MLERLHRSHRMLVPRVLEPLELHQTLVVVPLPLQLEQRVHQRKRMVLQQQRVQWRLLERVSERHQS